jgi:hypothetical protein
MERVSATGFIEFPHMMGDKGRRYALPALGKGKVKLAVMSQER